jgi:general secretion pathway protein J
MHSTRAEGNFGFTLVEMLVAISIFGVMAVVTYRVLDTVLVTRERVSEEYRRWRDVARAIAWLERDFEAVQARPVRDASDQLAAPLVGTEGLTQSDESAIAFTRSGELDESGLALPPSRIGYRVRDGILERLTWPGLDQATHSLPTVAVVLRGVAAVVLRYRDAAGAWQTNWPVTAPKDRLGGTTSHVPRSDAVDASLPAAIDITIQLARGERIRRLIPLQSGASS